MKLAEIIYIMELEPIPGHSTAAKNNLQNCSTMTFNEQNAQNSVMFSFFGPGGENKSKMF
jgi:hypothetical protein